MKRYLLYQKKRGLDSQRIGTCLLSDSQAITDSPLSQGLDHGHFFLSKDGSAMQRVLTYDEEFYVVEGVQANSQSPYVYQVELEEIE